MSYKDKVSGQQIIIRKKERLPYGTGDRGKFIPAEKGRRAIFVPSFGTMETDEIDYIVEASKEKEDERIKRNEKSQTRETIEGLVDAASRVPKGQKAKVIKEILEEG